ncbi:ferredoxin [Desulfitobacterium sp.]|uniref:ferredoxin n=1 Tax=Desulfitobacterium sp. TaxID=49981 RepID=UPI002BF49511|nr:ferredoxin [Desulfitobacterium sp.]HVJ48276.1 ferredoxin [Desulfitobacterium sp.]
MTAKVDKSACIGCGLCSSTCPNVFRMEDDGLASVYTDPVPDADKESVQEACESCPVSAISIED